MYAKINGDTITPYSLYQLKQDNPNISFPADPSVELLADHGVVFYKTAETPQHDELTQYCSPSDITLVGTEYIRNWLVTDKDLNEASISVRKERDNLLLATDWRFRSDMTTSQAWIDYCKELRDVTNQTGFPYSVIWPIKPE